MEHQLLEFGKVKDTVTGLTGMITAMQMEMDGTKMYQMRTRGLKEDGTPLDAIWLIEARLTGAKQVTCSRLPVEVFGTHVEDVVSGFKGTATAIMLFDSGCVHVIITPKAIKGKKCTPVNCDYLHLKGPAIKSTSKKERQHEMENRPSAPVDAQPYCFGS
jgi:hypothetical protein